MGKEISKINGNVGKRRRFLPLQSPDKVVAKCENIANVAQSNLFDPSSRIAAFIIFIALIMPLCIPQSALSQPSLDDANRFIRNGWAALRAGNNLEAHGDVNRAIAAYQDAGKFAAESLRIGDLHRIPLPQRPSGAYFLYGQTKLALAQVYIVQHRPMGQILNQLFEAENAFKDTLKINDLKAVQRDRQGCFRTVGNGCGNAGGRSVWKKLIRAVLYSMLGPKALFDHC